MTLIEPVTSRPEAGRTVTDGGGSSAELKLAGEQSGGSLGEHVMNVVESTIPSQMTIVQWRRRRRRGEQPCDHLHDTASRYDQGAKRLELLLTCPVCKTEKVIHSLAYEPRFEPSGATIHPLRGRERKTLDRAA